MTKSAITDYDLETLKEGLASQTIMLIDIREASDYAAGHIPGAVSLPLSRLDMRVVSLLSAQGQGRRLVLVGKSPEQSRQAIELLNNVGVAVDTHFSQGVTAWQEAGEPMA